MKQKLEYKRIQPYYNVEDDDYAHLGLELKDIVDKTRPVLENIDPESDTYIIDMINVMRNPDYFHWTVKTLLGIDLLPTQVVILRNLWNHNFPMYIASRGFGKSFLLAVYCLLRNLFFPGNKIVIVGAAFRQSKIIFEYMETMWKGKGASVYRSLCTDRSGPSRDIDRCTMRINDSWTIAVPLGTGDKIRGLRAHTIIADEFDSVPVEIYETVVAGFAAVTADPIKNVKATARKKRMQRDGRWTDTAEQAFIESKTDNQAILSGTCGYDFGTFASYWKKYCSIIKNRGDFLKVAKETGEAGQDISEDALPEYMTRLDWKNFCVIRVPYELIPEGFMDDQQVVRARATMHIGTYNMEYGAVFAKDSMGFFKRSLIEGCVASQRNCDTANWPKWCPDPFDVVTKGDRSKGYVYGIDPASEEDNFAICVMELHPDHQRLVHVWTTNKTKFQLQKKMGMTDANDYYSFCGRKIRELMKNFPCIRMGIDSQGGGYAIAETLADSDKLGQGEKPIYEIIDPDKEKETDFLPGLHIIQFAQFAKAEWLSQANHGLRKDMQDKSILFPRYDPVSSAIASEKDRIQFNELKSRYGEEAAKRLYDSVEDVFMEVEDLKNELCTIVVTVTPAGRERWDTPEIKTGVGKKGRMRKDRYSALVIANAIARETYREVEAPAYVNVGGVVGNGVGGKGSFPVYNNTHPGRMYQQSPDWVNANPGIYRSVKRK